MTMNNLKPFDTADKNNARPIYCVHKGDIAQSTAPASLLDLADLNGFSGASGSVLIGEAGVLYGVGDGNDVFALAGAASSLPEGTYYLADELSPQEAAMACRGWAIGSYRFDRYKEKRSAAPYLIVPEGVDFADVENFDTAQGLVRDLVNTPANDMTPSALEAAARDLASQFGAEINVIKGDALLADNYNMIHAVGRAATDAPRLIDIRWGADTAPKFTLVGKGVTFDSGGLNIKGGVGMALMKKDMGGAAHSLGLARLIMAAGLNVRLRVLIPAVENAIAGNAFRPGDVLRSRAGLSVEIGNTDAEGRLILADAMALGAEEHPELMITLATLTGAARVALGPEVIPFYTDDIPLAGELSAASASQSDPLWRMPLWENYEAMLASDIADINHISGGAFAGSITAALFLKRFAGEGVPWAHFDIYAWRPKSAPGRPVGAAVQAIFAIFAVLQQRYGSKDG